MASRLDRTRELAVGFAKMYALTAEALVQEGVHERTARKEAHSAATTWLLEERAEMSALEAAQDVQPKKHCPLCGGT